MDRRKLERIYNVIKIVLMVELILFSIIVSMKFKSLYEKYDRLNKRLEQLEIQYRLYEYDLQSTLEYLR